MKTPAWLQALALLLWGIALGHGAVGWVAGWLAGLLVGGLLGGLRVLVEMSGWRLQFGEAELNRSVDLTALLLVATVIGLLAAFGLPRGLLVAMGWMPAVLLPLLLLARMNEAPLRLRHMARSLRGSTRPEAAVAVVPDAPFLAVTLLATAAMGTTAWVTWGMGGLIVLWLGVVRGPQRSAGATMFVLTAIAALGLAYAGALGLQRAHLALEEWFINTLAGADTDPYQSQTRIGDLGRVKLSERIVWRVQQRPPAAVPLLLRTGVFTQYRNGIWLAQRDAFTPLPASARASPARLVLRGDSQQGMVLLPMPLTPGEVSAPGRLERNALGVLRLSDAPALVDIAVARGDASRASLPGPNDLGVPPEFAATLEKLPALTALRQAGEAARLAGIAAWFAANFRYTLFIGDEVSGRRDMATFLLSDRAGHCEYFASATVLLLRALGVPARYVTGYSVQEYSRLEKAFVVRKRHAHAWAEAFVDGRWVEVDTTPSTWVAMEEGAVPFWQPALDVLSYAWRRLGEMRSEVMSGQHAIALWVAGALLLLAALVWVARKHSRRADSALQKVGAGDTPNIAPCAELRAFTLLEQEFAALGLARDLGETPRAWLARIAEDGRSVTDVARLATARRIIDALYRQRYAALENLDSGPT